MTLLGKTIGNFRVIDIIGEGGMGEVYIGYDERLKRKVALKALRGERRFDEKAKTRLLREAELLSKLEHPNICRLYDFLETSDADVLVLELIKGKTLNRLNISALSRSEKLKIAIQIAVVLSEAHALSVVHRDLKPENIMIDDRGEVKVLDFGLAYSILDQETVSKMLSGLTSADFNDEIGLIEKIPGAGFRTEQGIVIGTPMYMSPEQAHCKPATAASDMYSLGLLLQWLFSGKAPYPPDVPIEEIFVRAGAGKTLPPEGVDGDLRTLIERLKSVEPSRRPTAVDTVEHLRWIEDAPRRKARKTAVAAVIGVLAIGVAVTGLSLFRAKKSERMERVARQRQERMSEFLVDMWISPSPMEQGRDVKVVDVLEYGKDKVEDQFDDDPILKARLLNHLGNTYRRLGEYGRADTILTECLEYSKSNLGQGHPRTIQVMIDLGIILSYDERIQEAEDLFREALSLGEENLPAGNELIVYAKEQLAEILTSNAEFDEAEQLYREILSVLREDADLQYKFGPKVLLDLGNLLLHKEDLPGAKAIFIELLEDYESRGETENPNYIAAKGSVARILMEQGQQREGLEYMREALDLSTRVNGERNRTTIVFLINYGEALTQAGDYSEALVYTRRGYDLFRDIFGEKAPDTAFIGVNYADLLRKLGRVEEAEPLLDAAVALDTETFGSGHPRAIRSSYSLAELYLDTGRFRAAEELIREVARSSFESLGEKSEFTLECRDLLGRILNGKGDFEGAEAIHREVLAAKTAAYGADSPSLASTALNLARSLYLQGLSEESAPYAEQAVRSNVEMYGAGHPDTKASVELLKEVFAAAGRSAQSDSLLQSLGVTP